MTMIYVCRAGRWFAWPSETPTTRAEIDAEKARIAQAERDNPCAAPDSPYDPCLRRRVPPRQSRQP